MIKSFCTTFHRSISCSFSRSISSRFHPFSCPNDWGYIRPLILKSVQVRSVLVKPSDRRVVRPRKDGSVMATKFNWNDRRDRSVASSLKSLQRD
ncbi:hypothetical protein DEO72_LG3g2872 [Vigna unguiculata]|uniref:Uncharacterized protein n=1 Tax=Vigna unguiculata TaxID=3917 RepID=A0A4D6LIJ2_VIGUN|nr:hypothetical protein DEO72_LG3g2872 [Vigna unguiculata]